LVVVDIRKLGEEGQSGIVNEERVHSNTVTKVKILGGFRQEEGEGSSSSSSSSPVIISSSLDGTVRVSSFPLLAPLHQVSVNRLQFPSGKEGRGQGQNEEEEGSKNTDSSSDPQSSVLSFDLSSSRDLLVSGDERGNVCMLSKQRPSDLLKGSFLFSSALGEAGRNRQSSSSKPEEEKREEVLKQLIEHNREVKLRKTQLRLRNKFLTSNLSLLSSSSSSSSLVARSGTDPGKPGNHLSLLHDENSSILSSGRKSLKKYETLLKKFRYEQCFQKIVFYKKDPVLVSAIIQELRRRDGLRVAIKNFDSSEVLVLLQMINKYISQMRFQPYFLHLFHVVLDVFLDDISTNPAFVNIMRTLSEKLSQLIVLKTQFSMLRGQLEMMASMNFS
jgi:hypothetical protein